ncbi:porin family protein [Phreatobacter aquaticus]|uniref:Porin family protein n=1 Tax=Phreatobacter aquaticus TaxID=2570229 RepID=A0A4D7QJQ1_9HYPH|nr:outer membrane beta-barrel protein [Phreatobacter aquaticus]QCK86861.1 porin family protein [Phreatobacter aquaticus]
MTLRTLLAASIALGALTAGARAADLGQPRMPIASAIAAPAFSWAGFYFGLNAGYAFGRTAARDLGDINGTPWYILGGRFSTSANGFTGGAQAGYNWQSGRIVAGFEADLGYLGTRGTGLYNAGGLDTFITTRGGLAGTLRGRLGVAADRALFYVTGGAIAANVNSFVPSFAAFRTSSTGAQIGWTVGAGIEYAVAQNWSIKAEYLYYDLGSKRVVMNNGGISPFDIRSNGNIVRVGVNYLFNTGSSAVVARY